MKKANSLLLSITEILEIISFVLKLYITNQYTIFDFVNIRQFKKTTSCEEPVNFLMSIIAYSFCKSTVYTFLVITFETKK